MTNDGVHIYIRPNGPFTLKPKCSSMVGFQQVVYNVFQLRRTLTLNKGGNLGVDTPPSSLMDSITSPKMKTMKGKRVEARSLARNTSGQMGVLKFWDGDQEDWQANHLLTLTCTNQTTNQLVRSWNTLVHRQATGKHKLTRFTMAQTWGKPPPSPLQYILCMATRPTPKCHFVLGLPSGSPKIPKVGTLTTLGAHNFVCKPLTEVKSEVKLQLSLRTFQWYVAHHLHARKLG